MLENYYGKGAADKATPEQRQRLIAVEAALAIAIAAAPKSGVHESFVGLENLLDKAADAIQGALKK
ncbi:hypothetical protein [Citrobacter sp. Igbk 14]|uniref:hypothetical protein n=1 Tax=Citrobacter sp. Igbk 14 TaxID=2963960 RepID=UPI002303D1B6|nr:hypothetical protein [Citrobacter sp. Igbk 14]MDA8512856.1 hypothetical protein [Citrobacter sp. Igbk 14]